MGYRAAWDTTCRSCCTRSSASTASSSTVTSRQPACAPRAQSYSVYSPDRRACPPRRSTRVGVCARHSFHAGYAIAVWCGRRIAVQDAPLSQHGAARPARLRRQGRLDCDVGSASADPIRSRVVPARTATYGNARGPNGLRACVVCCTPRRMLRANCCMLHAAMPCCMLPSHSAISDAACDGRTSGRTLGPTAACREIAISMTS